MFNVLWERQFSFVNYKDFSSYNMVAQFVRITNNPELTERYRELNSARTLLAIYQNNNTVRWCLNNEEICTEALKKYTQECTEDNFDIVDNFNPGKKLQFKKNFIFKYLFNIKTIFFRHSFGWR